MYVGEDEAREYEKERDRRGNVNVPGLVPERGSQMIDRDGGCGKEPERCQWSDECQLLSPLLA